MKKFVTLVMFAAVVSLCSGQMKSASTSMIASERSQPAQGHYRFTFVVTDPKAKVARKTFSFEVKTTPEHAGEGTFNISSAPTAPVAGGDDMTEHMQFTCAEVRETAVGLEAQVSMEVGRILDELAPGTNEHIHRQVNLNRKIELAIGTPVELLRVSPRDDDKMQVTLTADKL